MYKRFAERKGFKVTIVEEMTADFGIKSVEMRIDGPFAYGLLRCNHLSIHAATMMMIHAHSLSRSLARICTYASN